AIHFARAMREGSFREPRPMFDAGEALFLDADAELAAGKRGGGGIAVEDIEADDDGVAVGAWSGGVGGFAIAGDCSRWRGRQRRSGFALLSLLFPKLRQLEADLVLVNRKQKCQMETRPAVEKSELENVHGEKADQPSRGQAMPDFVLDPAPPLHRTAPEP